MQASRGCSKLSLELWWTSDSQKLNNHVMDNLCRHQHRCFHTHVTCYYSPTLHALFTMTSVQGDSSPQQNGAGLFGGRSKSSPDAPTGPQKQKKIGAKLVDAKPAFGDEVCCEILSIQRQLHRAHCSVACGRLASASNEQNAVCDVICHGPAWHRALSQACEKSNASCMPSRQHCTTVLPQACVQSGAFVAIPAIFWKVGLDLAY